MTLADLRALATGTRDGYRVWEGDLGKMAVTLEDAEFLYALVRLVKPDLVLELGAGLGVSARFIAEACEMNTNGVLFTWEPVAGLASAAASLLSGLPAEVIADGDLGGTFSRDGVAVSPDLVFIDSGWEYRETHIEAWLTGDYPGLVVVHDSERRYAQLELGAGVYLPGTDGMWIGRAE